MEILGGGGFMSPLPPTISSRGEHGTHYVLNGERGRKRQRPECDLEGLEQLLWRTILDWPPGSREDSLAQPGPAFKPPQVPRGRGRSTCASPQGGMGDETGHQHLAWGRGHQCPGH